MEHSKVKQTENVTSLKYTLYQTLIEQREATSTMLKLTEELGLIVDASASQPAPAIDEISLVDIVSEISRQSGNMALAMGDIEGRLI